MEDEEINRLFDEAESLPSEKEFYEKKLKLYYIAALGGHIKATYIIGECFSKGYLGVEINYDKAIFYYILAANDNCYEACYALSNIFLHSNSENFKDYNEGIKYLIKAADNGHTEAKYELDMYLKQDKEKTLNNFIEAANQNYSNIPETTIQNISK